MTPLAVYTDGSCSLTHGGWAWTYGVGERNDSGYVADTTNQRMEVHAALQAVLSHAEPIAVHSDSAYLINCFTQEWHVRWVHRGWRNAEGRPVANRDLWEQLIPLVTERGTTFVKVRGHAGVPGNEEADRLAVLAMERGRRR